MGAAFAAGALAGLRSLGAAHQAQQQDMVNQLNLKEMQQRFLEDQQDWKARQSLLQSPDIQKLPAWQQYLIQTDPRALATIMKPASPIRQGAGVRMTDAKGNSYYWYPQTNSIAQPPSGLKFPAGSVGSPVTKSFEVFLGSKSVGGKPLDWETYRALPPAQKEALYQEYRSTLAPDQQLKVELEKLRAQALTQQMKLNAAEWPLVMKMMQDEEAQSKATSSAPSVLPAPATPDLFTDSLP